jgi:hypothetical protein
MPRFIPVEDGLATQRLLEFLTRERDRVARFFPGRLCAPQTDRYVQSVGQQRLHHAARHPTDDGQIGDQGGELRAKLADHVRRQRRIRRRPTRGTDDARTLILGNVRVDRRQFRDLMAAWFTRDSPVPCQQSPLAAPTRGRKHFDDRIHALAGYYGTTMSGMARLAAGLAMTLRAAASRARTACQPVGRGRLRRCGRVLVAQGELPFQVRDLAIALRDFFTESFNLALQPFDFGRLTAVTFRCRLRLTRLFWERPSRLRITHAPYGTPPQSICTG